MKNSKKSNNANHNRVNPANDILLQIEELKSQDKINSYLGNKGYSIYKDCLTDEIIEFIKTELTVKPLVQTPLIDPPSFPVYQESAKKIYIPRFWGIQIFGYPKYIKISAGSFPKKPNAIAAIACTPPKFKITSAPQRSAV